MPKEKIGTLRGGFLASPSSLSFIPPHLLAPAPPPPPNPLTRAPTADEWRARRRAEREAREARGGGAEPLFADMLGSGAEFDDLQGEGLSEWVANLGKLMTLLKMRLKGGAYDQAELEELQGEGIFDWVKNLVNVVRKPTEALQSMPKPIADFNAIYDNYSIVSIEICREPLSSGLQNIIDRASSGTLLKSLKDANYEALYHLYANVYLRDDKTGKTKSFRIEKNQRVEVFDKISPPKGGKLGECKGVPNIQPKTWWWKFWQNTNADTFQYSANRNNCQAFLKTRLEALGLLTPELKNFIMQDIDKLIPGAEIQKSIAKGITNAASILQNIFVGGEYEEGYGGMCLGGKCKGNGIGYSLRDGFYSTL